MGKKKILILGAGLAGLSAAWHLQRRGIPCRIFEKEAEPGGLCRSKYINGFTFDFDGHLLHFKYPYAFRLIRSLLGGNLAKHKREAWVYSYGRYIRYPFQANLYRLPVSVAKECLLGFIQAAKNNHGKIKKDIAFSEWINRAFGPGIARHFMAPYNTKFWTLPPEKLSCEWLDGFIPVPSLRQVIKGSAGESQKQFGYNAHFWYPKKGGINQLSLALASETKNIHLGCRVSKIDLAKKEIKLASGDKEKFDYVISTIPLPEMPLLLGQLPPEMGRAFGKLRWNSIFNLNIGTEKNGRSSRHWVYFPQEDISFFRVGFYNNFSVSNTPSGRDSLYVEVAYSKDKPIEKRGIISRIKRDLNRAGIIGRNNKVCCQQINDIKYGYPIYDGAYQKSRGAILKFLARNSVLPCGRYGSWRYMSMEGAIIDGKTLAESIAKNVK